MPRATDGTLLPDDDWNQLQEYADRFGEARRKGPVNDWEPYLPAPGQPLRRPVLLEDVKIDIEATWKEDSRALVETYETLFPEVAPIPVDLIVEEYRIRHRHGDKPDLEEYRSRFPDQFAEIEQRARERPPGATGPKFHQAPAPAAPPPSPAVTNLFPPGYTPMESIGRGNFAEVWRAEAPGGIAVAVKIISQPLDNEAAKREQQSLEIVKTLQHPKLLSTLAFWIIENRLVIAMELADGTLRDRLSECKANGMPGIPAEELLTYFRDTAEGLDWLHWQGVLHRDIKPENILLKHGYAKVGDFGLVRSGMPGELVSTSFAGTPAFMAPEMWGGKAGPSSDQYSLAFTYAELRLGRRPLEGGDFVAVMNSALEGTPNLEGLSEPEKTVLRRALSKRAEERFDSCQEFVEALERVLTPDGRAARRRHAPESLRKRPADATSPTDRTDHGSDKPKKLSDSKDQTLRQEPSVPKTPVVWKPPGPESATAASPAKIILIVLVALGILGAGGLGACMLWPKPERTKPEPTAPPTSPPEPTKTKNGAPIEDPVVVPPGFASGGKETATVNGKKRPQRIVFSKHSDAGFLLMQPDDPKYGPPYYVAENKVSNALFQAFLDAHPGFQTAWKNGEPQQLQWPALMLTWAEARDCAGWMNGQLPTPEQLDYAAGITNRKNRTGPTKGDVGVAIKQSQPLPVNRIDNDDVSPLGVRDLGGNGREWTSKKLLVGGEDFYVLRGRMYTLSKPLTYEQLVSEQSDANCQIQRPAVRSPQTGFRVVVKLE